MKCLYEVFCLRLSAGMSGRAICRLGLACEFCSRNLIIRLCRTAIVLGVTRGLACFVVLRKHYACIDLQWLGNVLVILFFLQSIVSLNFAYASCLVVIWLLNLHGASGEQYGKRHGFHPPYMANA